MDDLNALPLPKLFADLTRDGCLDQLIAGAINEDMRKPGDVTSNSIIPAAQTACAAIVVRHGGMIAGIEPLRHLMENYAQLEIETQTRDGEEIEPGASIARLSGKLRTILLFERIGLNLIGRLSGIATLTRQYVDAVRGTNTVICDTRKTTPGLRNLEKYAVRCGGGTLHRIGLFDAALYKDNHLAGIELDLLASKLTAAITTARRKNDLRFVEVEVDTLDQLREILNIQPGLVDMILLDNMTDDQLRKAVAMRNAQSTIHNPQSTIPSPLLECSGGVTLDRVRSIAQTGVDRISVGAITHSAPWLDIGMDIEL